LHLTIFERPATVAKWQSAASAKKFQTTYQAVEKRRSAASAKKIQTAYVCLNTLRVLDFFASLHLTIFERPATVAKWRSAASAKKIKVVAV
jgi:uncharacterized protein YcnI